MTPLERAYVTVVSLIGIAMVAALMFICAVVIAVVTLPAIPLVVFWAAWKPVWKSINEGRRP